MQQNNIFWFKIGSGFGEQGGTSPQLPGIPVVLLSHHNIKDLEVRRKYFSTNLPFNSVRYVMKHCLLFDMMLFHNFLLCSVGRLAQVQ